METITFNSKSSHKLKLKQDYSKFQIYGIQGSGKTYFTKKLIESGIFKKPIVYIVNKDDDYQKVSKLYAYEPKNVLNEFQGFIIWARKLALEGKIDCIVIDEADLFLRYNFEVSTFDELNDLLLNHRHYKVSMVFISRRPQDLPTKIVESCKHTFIFKLEGANALKKFNDIEAGLGDKIKKLDYKSHSFYYKHIGDPAVFYPAIK